MPDRWRTALLMALLGLFAVPAASQARLSAAEPQMLGRTRQQWLAEMDVSISRRRRTLAAWSLAELAVQQAGSAESMIWLNELLLLCEDESSSIRFWGLTGVQRFALKLPADHISRPTVIKVFGDGMNDPSIANRLAAAEGLASLEELDLALPLLTGALASEQESVRIQAISALERLGETARPAQRALQAAANDSSEYVKRISARALAKLSTPK